MEQVVKPIYQQIAIDIASRIAKGEIAEGIKMHGRSTLASQYNVSPETVRRAVILLEDMEIVKVTQGRGITVISRENAFKFINKFKDIDSVSSIRKDISKLLKERMVIEQSLNEQIEKLVDYTERFRNSNPFNPLEIEVPKESGLIGKNIGEVKFWQNTGATIIGIRRENTLVLSPGPYATFQEKDILIIVGEEGCYERVKNFFNEKI